MSITKQASILLVVAISLSSGCKPYQSSPNPNASATESGGIGSWFTNGRDPASTPPGTDFVPTDLGPLSGKR